MRHLVVVVDWKDEFPLEAAAECRAQWGSLYVVEAENLSDAIVWVLSDKFMNEVEATRVFTDEERRTSRRGRR